MFHRYLILALIFPWLFSEVPGWEPGRTRAILRPSLDGVAGCKAIVQEATTDVQEATTEPAVARSDNAQRALQDFLLNKCGGGCHRGANRLVPELDMNEFAQLVAKEKGYVTPGSPESSMVWKRVTDREMPPANWGTLARADREKLYQLIVNLDVGGDEAPSPSQSKVNGGGNMELSPSQPEKELQNIVATGEQDPRLAKFLSWARRNGVVDELLRESGPFTILAPTNEAFEALKSENLSHLEGNSEHLRTLLLNHGFIGYSMMEDLVRAGKVETVMSRLAVQRKSDQIWIGEAQVVQSDIRCSNGVIHVIDKVLVPLRVSRELPNPDTAVHIGPAAMKMIVLQGGLFQMGSPRDEVGRFDDEGPQHQVVLDPFMISRYEITRTQYLGVMFQDPSDDNMPGRRDFAKEDPVQSVNWFEAVQFCNRLSELDAVEPYYVLTLDGRGANGKPTYRVTVPDPSASGYRLLTEAEWEYACRAGSTSAYCFGDSVDQLKEHAWYQQTEEGYKTRRVGDKEANAFGLYDMHGNVAEWCHDWYVAAYAQAGTVTNPMGPASGEDKVVRGGSYLYTKYDLRSAARHQRRPPWYTHRTIGIRVGRYLPPNLRPGARQFADVTQ